MVIPCKDCLILPICKQKETVMCDWLHEEAKSARNGSISGRDWWKKVTEYLPKAEAIRNSKGVL